jgi:hypothetical protein
VGRWIARCCGMRKQWRCTVESVPFIEVVYDTSPGTTIRAARRGLLMEGLRLLTLKQDGHDDLHGLSHQSIIPYVHREDCCIVVCVLQASIELA